MAVLRVNPRPPAGMFRAGGALEPSLEGIARRSRTICRSYDYLAEGYQFFRSGDLAKLQNMY
jgi:hypothetical protein